MRNFVLTDDVVPKAVAVFVSGLHKGDEKAGIVAFRHFDALVQALEDRWICRVLRRLYHLHRDSRLVTARRFALVRCSYLRRKECSFNLIIIFFFFVYYTSIICLYYT